MTRNELWVQNPTVILFFQYLNSIIIIWHNNLQNSPLLYILFWFFCLGSWFFCVMFLSFVFCLLSVPSWNLFTLLRLTTYYYFLHFNTMLNTQSLPIFRDFIPLTFYWACDILIYRDYSIISLSHYLALFTLPPQAPKGA